MILKKQSGIKNVFLSLVTLSFFIFNFFSCKDNTVDPPPDNKPPGYQEDIPWPSLADSPWPTLRADMQRTGRSKYIGPQRGIIAAKIPAFNSQTGVVFANDSVLYYTTSSNTKLIAAKLDSSLIWSLSLYSNETTTTPLVNKNGIIYAADAGKIYAIYPDGKLKWAYNSDKAIYCRSLAIGKDGIIYGLKAGPILFALDGNGNLLWNFSDIDFNNSSTGNLAFSPDGNILYINGSNVTLAAFDLALQKIKWKFGIAIAENGPVVDSKGNIYMFIQENGQGIIYCISPAGSVLWKYPHPLGEYYSGTDPAIDKNGNVYFASDTLYSLDYEGKLRWKLPLGFINTSSLICDAQGTVYVAGGNELEKWNIYAVSKEGFIKWNLSVEGERAPGDCPAITRNGTLVYPTFRSRNLLIIN